MEPIKIEVSVELNVSKDLKDFFTQLVLSAATNSCGCKSTAVPTPVTAAPTVETPVKPATPVVETPVKPVTPVTVVPTVETPEPVHAVTAAETPSVTIEQVRAALASKINGHREEIKDKLNALGAPSVTKLDTAKYVEMMAFLNSLS